MKVTCPFCEVELHSKKGNLRVEGWEIFVCPSCDREYKIEVIKTVVKEGDEGWCNNPNSYHYATRPEITTIAGFKEECGRSCVDCPYFVKK